MKEEFLTLIDNHKNQLIDPVEMLRWTALRVFLISLPEEVWEPATIKTINTLSQ